VNHEALEHLLRAAAALTGEATFYVVGSAAILPSVPPHLGVPDVALRSREADLIPVSGSTRSIDLIDGALGLDSTFDGTFGYYADGVDLSTVRYVPARWRDRVVRFESRATAGAVAPDAPSGRTPLTTRAASRAADPTSRATIAPAKRNCREEGS
jgi:hypothetical protein